jgi:hypothetical protein
VVGGGREVYSLHKYLCVNSDISTRKFRAIKRNWERKRIRVLSWCCERADITREEEEQKSNVDINIQASNCSNIIIIGIMKSENLYT